MASPLKSLDDVIRRVADAAGSGTIRAYHGSPRPEHFDQFDASKIGTGEGAQAYGHGHYSAQNKAVADEYRRALSYKKLREDFLIHLGPESEPAEVMENIAVFDPRQQRFLRELDNNDWLGFDYPSQAISQAAGRQSGFAGYEVADSAHRAREQLGTGYELEIAHPETALLDWDATLVDQPSGVIHALKQLGMPAVDAVGSPVPGRPDVKWSYSGNELGQAYGFDSPWDIRGHNIYKAVATHPDVVQGVPFRERYRSASEALRGAGVPGIRYLDQGSRNTGPSGTRNYVMFPGTEDSIRILRKYGILAPVAAEAVSQTEE
jgi:hypothetical protein